MTARATILFQNDDFATVESNSILLNSDNEASSDIVIQFGAALGKTIRWSILNSRFEISDNLDLTNNQLTTARVENVAAMPGGAGGLGSGGTGRIVELTAIDNVAPGCTPTACTSGTYSWNGSIWKPLQGSITTSTATKIVTVGPTGRDYTTIAGAAAYCNTISGCEIWIDPGSYPVTASVDLENVRLIGSDRSLTTISITGSGQMQVRETTFEDLTINVNSAITAVSGLNVKFNASSNSALLFNKVDFIAGGSKVVIDSTAGTPPVTTVTLQNCSQSSGTGTLVRSVGTSGLNTASSKFTVIDLISTTALKMVDWPITIVGGSNVVTSGNIITVPDRTILVSPGMNIQAAINSLGANGGVIKLLIGTHDVTNELLITNDNIELVGEGPGTILRAQTGTWAGGTTADNAVIQVGLANGTAPRSNVIVRNFKVQVGPNIHGIEINGGTEVKVMDMIVQSTGTKTGTRTGIVITDSTAAAAQRMTVSRNIINNDTAGNRWVDGVHFDGDASLAGQTFGYGNTIRDSIISENIVSEAQETCYVFTGVSASSIFSNRARNIGFATGSLGLALINATDIMVINNTVETNNNTTTNGINLYDNVDSSTLIGNAINGNGTNFNNAIIVRDGASASSNNTIIGNQINGATTGISIEAGNTATSVSGNQFIAVTTTIADAGTGTKLETQHHRAAANPTVNDDIADGYGIGSMWINTATDAVFVLTDSAAGAAVWQPTGSSGNVSSLYTFMASGATETWANQPSGTTEFDGATNRRLAIDLSSATQARFQANVTTSGAGGATLRVQYSTNGGTSWTNLDGGTGPTIPVTSGLQTTAFFTIDVAARTDVLLRVVGQGGNGFTDPAFMTMNLEVR